MLLSAGACKFAGPCSYRPMSVAACNRHRSIAAGAGAQQQMPVASCCVRSTAMTITSVGSRISKNYTAKLHEIRHPCFPGYPRVPRHAAQLTTSQRKFTTTAIKFHGPQYVTARSMESPPPQIIAASCAGMRASAAAYTCRILGIHACSARAAGLLGAQTRRGISREAVHFSDAGVLCARLDIPRRMYSERRAPRD